MTFREVEFWIYCPFLNAIRKCGRMHLATRIRGLTISKGITHRLLAWGGYLIVV